MTYNKPASNPNARIGFVLGKMFLTAGLGGLCVVMLVIVLRNPLLRTDHHAFDRTRSSPAGVGAADALLAPDDAWRFTDALLAFAETPRPWSYADALLLLSLMNEEHLADGEQGARDVRHAHNETMRTIATRLRRGLPIDDDARALLLESLLSQIDHPDPPRRAIAARHVIDATLHRDPRVLSRIEELLLDEDPAVRNAAAYHIARIGVIDRWTVCAPKTDQIPARNDR